jgi:hypothetical protein
MSFSGSSREESTTTCAKEWCVMMISDRIKRDLFMEFKITAISVEPPGLQHFQPGSATFENPLIK